MKCKADESLIQDNILTLINLRRQASCYDGFARRRQLTGAENKRVLYMCIIWFRTCSNSRTFNELQYRSSFTITKVIINLTKEFINLNSRYVKMILHGKVKYDNDDIVFYQEDR